MDTDIPCGGDRPPFLGMLTTTPDTASEPVDVIWHPRYRPLLGHKVPRRRDIGREGTPDRCG